MSMPIANKNFYKWISFTSLSRHFTQIFFFEGNAMEMKLHCSFSALYILLMETYDKLMHEDITLFP